VYPIRLAQATTGAEVSASSSSSFLNSTLLDKGCGGGVLGAREIHFSFSIGFPKLLVPEKTEK